MSKCLHVAPELVAEWRKLTPFAEIHNCLLGDPLAQGNVKETDTSREPN